jgi:hypothetical protein
MVETLCKDVVRFVSLYLDGNVAEAGKFEEFRGFGGPWKGHKVILVGPSGDRRTDDICLTVMTSKPMLPRPSAMSSAGVL